MSTIAYVGSYTTTRRRGLGRGIEVFLVEDGTWRRIQSVPAVNPSWLLVNRAGTLLYAAHGDGTTVSTYAIATDGTLTELGETDSGGFNGVSLLESPDSRWLWVVNHVSGTLTTLALDEAGVPARISAVTAVSGKRGPDREEQPAPRPHHLVLSRDGLYAYVPDKGLDVIHQFSIDTDTGAFVPLNPPHAKARRAAGPRHAVLDSTGSMLLVVNEIDSTITDYEIAADGTLAPLRWTPTTPSSFFGHTMAAEIVHDPFRPVVAVSNRGHDSVAIFVHSKHETRRLCDVPTGGLTPRFMAIGPDGYLYVANQDAHSIVRLDFSEPSTPLAAEPVVAIGSPSSIVWVETA